jgi:uncharacterized protein YndB with AHSA1/START domain
MTVTETRTSTDRIEKRVMLSAPRSKVWRALTTAEQFGAWFGAKFDSAFAEGATMRGKMTSGGCGNEDNPSIELVVERIQPERLFSYRWHPYALDPKVDYSAEVMTLVEFRLEEVAGGTQLTIIESGFDSLSAARRAEAFPKHESGWVSQINNLERYVTGS